MHGGSNNEAENVQVVENDSKERRFTYKTYITGLIMRHKVSKMIQMTEQSEDSRTKNAWWTEQSEDSHTKNAWWV